MEAAALEKRLAGYREEGNDTAVAAELEKLRPRRSPPAPRSRMRESRCGVAGAASRNHEHVGFGWKSRSARKCADVGKGRGKKAETVFRHWVRR